MIVWSSADGNADSVSLLCWRTSVLMFKSALNIMLCSGSMASKPVVSEARYTHYVAVLTSGGISYK